MSAAGQSGVYPGLAGVAGILTPDNVTNHRKALGCSVLVRGSAEQGLSGPHTGGQTDSKVFPGLGGINTGIGRLQGEGALRSPSPVTLGAAVSRGESRAGGVQSGGAGI